MVKMVYLWPMLLVSLAIQSLLTSAIGRYTHYLINAHFSSAISLTLQEHSYFKMEFPINKVHFPISKLFFDKVKIVALSGGSRNFDGEQT